MEEEETLGMNDFRGDWRRGAGMGPDPDSVENVVAVAAACREDLTK